MNPTLPDWLLAELEQVSDPKLRKRLEAGVEFALYEIVRDLLDRFAAIRTLLIYFNTAADWDSALTAIRDIMRADAVQIVNLKNANELMYHLLPADQAIDVDFAAVLEQGVAIDERTPDELRLGVLLAVNADLLGVLLVIRKGEFPFSDYDRSVLANLASEMSIALNNLELYTLLAEQAEYLASLVRNNYQS